MESNTSFSLRVDTRQGSNWPGQPELPVGKEDEREETLPLDAIFCTVCGATITNRDRKIAVQGTHAHTFFNPAGIVFELGCFSTAPGCNRAGEATSEFTWFAGYVWRFAFCRSCNSHLGWYFENGGHSFWGLILANLRE